MPPTITRDLRDQFGPARDQNPRPTCMAFAASDAHAAARPGWDPLSAEWAYYHGLRHDGGKPHDGVSMESMLQALREDGQPVETQWPYTSELFTDISGWKPPACSPLFRRASDTQSASIERIMACLDAEQPVIIVMSISRAFFAPEADGVVQAHEPLEVDRTHAVIAVGYGTQSGETFVLIRNSWGSEWGIAGYAWLAHGYLKPRVLAAAVMEGEE